jgi:DNA-binding transcriptional MerR regulator
MEEIGGWSARSLARLIGVPPQTVQYWVASGLIIPEKVGRGRGGFVIGLRGLMEAVTILELRKRGFSLQKIREAVENLRQLSGCERPLTCLTLVAAGNELVWQYVDWKNADEVARLNISALHRPGQALLFLPLGELHEGLLHRLDAASVEPPEAEARQPVVAGSSVRRQQKGGDQS